MGASAIGLVRVSGPEAVATVAGILKASSALDAFPSHALRRVTVVDPHTGARLDEALCAVMRAPRSYTGEDVVELSCHGSPALLSLVVRRLVAAGARLAEPGEFTRRAFLNGRLDLAQAEAVALMIGARTERALALAARALAGGLSAEVRALREDLLALVAGLEVRLDFPEERVGVDVDKARGELARLRGDVEGWLRAAHHGRLVHDGMTVAIVGPPNAGKSSLLNALLGHDRAIVSAAPGTTRDVVEGLLALAGVPVRLLDTAGLDRPRDAIEAEGIRRSRRAIEESDLLLVVFDGSVTPDARVLEETSRRARLVVRSKSDLAPHRDASLLPGALAVSALTGEGLEALVERLADEARSRTTAAGDEGGIVATLRQLELLEALRGALASGEAALAAAPLEVALLDLREALGDASAILGIDVGDAVLDRIFSTFCLGK
jgi:tRNA modification GTPase